MTHKIAVLLALYRAYGSLRPVMTTGYGQRPDAVTPLRISRAVLLAQSKA